MSLPVINPASLATPDLSILKTGGLTAAGAFIDAYRTGSTIAREREQSQRADEQVAMQKKRQQWEEEDRRWSVPLEKRQAELQTSAAELNQKHAALALEADRQKLDRDQQATDMLMKSVSVPVTQYSTGKAAGGPDEAQDRWTNKGYSATGKNLTEGMAAVNPKVFPHGTVFRDDASGEVFVAGDSHGNRDANVIDLYKDPANYKGGKETRNFSIIDKVDKVPDTPEGVKSLLDNYRGKPSTPAYIKAVNSPEADEIVIARSMPPAQMEMLAAHRQLTSLAQTFSKDDPRRAVAVGKLMEIESQPEFAIAQAEHTAQMQAAVAQRTINTSIRSAPLAQQQAFTQLYGFGLKFLDGQAVPVNETGQPLKPSEQEAFLQAWGRFDADVKKNGIPRIAPQKSDSNLENLTRIATSEHSSPALRQQAEAAIQAIIAPNRQTAPPTTKAAAPQKTEPAQAEAEPMTYQQVKAAEAEAAKASANAEAVKEISATVNTWAAKDGVPPEAIAKSVLSGERFGTGQKHSVPVGLFGQVNHEETTSAAEHFAKAMNLSPDNLKQWAETYRQSLKPKAKTQSAELSPEEKAREERLAKLITGK